MKPRVLLALTLLLYLSLALALALGQEQEQPGAAGKGKRRRGGKKPGRNRAMRQPPPDVRLPTVPVNGGDDGASIFIQSYRSVHELESHYNVIPGKKGACMYQGIAMFDWAVWSPKPCLTCLCSSGEVVCDEVQCPPLRCPQAITPAGECCPVCARPVPDVLELSGDSPDPNDPTGPELAHPHTQAEIDDRLRKEEEEHREEEEQLKKKDAERKLRRKQKKLEAEKQRKLEEERRREEEEQEEERRREEEEAAAKEKKQRMKEERRREEERRKEQEKEQRQLLRALEEAEELEEREEREEGAEGEQEEQEEQEEEFWLRGDVFQMPPRGPSVEDVLPLPAPDSEDTLISPSLPAGCVISDIAVSCENAKLTGIPPLSIPELKALSLEGNIITTIPAGAFNGVPNLERLNLGKNKITSAGIHPGVFKNLRLLTRLYMDGNLLEQIPTNLPSGLQELKVSENKLQRIDEDSFEDMNNLVTLELEGNLLSEGNVDPLAFEPLTQLSYLRLGRNHFRTIPQGLPKSLQELYLENNLIEEISEAAFNHTRNLNIVVLRHNKLEESRIAPLAWIDHKNLESIDLSHNEFYHVPSFLPRSLVHLVLVGNRIERIPGYVFAHMEPGIEYLYLSFNNLDSEGIDPVSFFGAFHSMAELFLDHNRLTTVPIGINEMRSLRFLRLNDNNIRNFAEESICDPLNDEDSGLVTLRLENNFIDSRKVPPTAFSCIRSYSSVVLKPQKVK